MLIVIDQPNLNPEIVSICLSLIYEVEWNVQLITKIIKIKYKVNATFCLWEFRRDIMYICKYNNVKERTYRGTYFAVNYYHCREDGFSVLL